MRNVVAVISASCIGVGITSCGSGAPVSTIVRVGDHTITSATLDHWARIEAVLAYDSQPTRAIPAGLVPDPPAYTACSKYLRNVEPAARTASAAAVRRECKARHRHIREHVLNILISFAWMLEEGERWHITASHKDAMGQLRAIIHADFNNSTAEFNTYLKNTGLTLSEELLRIRVNIISARLLQKLISVKKAAGEGLMAVYRYLSEIPRRWTAKTHCDAGYVIPECKEYKGSLEPEVAV